MGYIDPHGQDAEEILRAIPSWRADDVVYFNAANFAYPMGWNLLSSDRIDPTDRDRVASIIVSGFQGIFGDSWGPNLEYILFGCLHTLLARERTSILGVPRLITERDYRAHFLQYVKDPGARMFWKNFAKQEAEHKDATTSVISKVGRLFLSATMRNIFGQPVNSSANSTRKPEPSRPFSVTPGTSCRFASARKTRRYSRNTSVVTTSRSTIPISTITPCA